MAEVPVPDTAAGPVAGPAGRVGARWIALLALANLGLYVGYYGPQEVLLPDQVQAIAGNDHVVAFGWVTGISAVVAMIAHPLAGALSDRTVSRFGRRHPWTVGGALAAAAGLALLAGQHTLAGVTVFWCVGLAGLHSMQASLTGNGGYVLVAVLVMVFAAPFVLFTPDLRLTRGGRPPFAWREFTRAFWVSPRRYPDFAWAWGTRFTVMLGNSIAILYLLYFLRDKLHYSRLFPGQTAEDGLLILILIYTVGA